MSVKKSSIKSNRYGEMRLLQANLRRLYKELNYEPERLKITSPGKVKSMLESVFDSKEAEGYLRKMNQQISQAWKAASEKNRMVGDLKRQQEETEQELTALREEMRHLESESRQKIQCQEEAETARKDKFAMIRELIEIRNGMQMQLYLYQTKGSSKDEKAKTMTSSYLEKLKIALESVGVEVTEEQGVYDSKRQMVWESIKTRNRALHNQIAAVLRSGYKYEGKLLQIEEVVVYQKE